MAMLDWDRTLETCVKRGWNAVLLAGHAPYWRGPGGLRRGMIEAVSAEELEAMWREVMPGPERLSAIPGCRSVVLSYGDEFRFRMDVLGESTPKAIVLTQLGADVSESFGQGGRLFEGWTPGEGSVNWWALYQWIVGGHGADVILCPGVPPVLWTERGAMPFDARPLQGWLVAALRREMVSDEHVHWVKDGGYGDFVVGDERVSYVRGAIFGRPMPDLVLLMKLATRWPRRDLGRVSGN